MSFVVNTIARPNYKSFDRNNGGLGMNFPSVDIPDIIPPQTEEIDPIDAMDGVDKSASAVMSCGSRFFAAVLFVLAVSAASILI